MSDAKHIPVPLDVLSKGSNGELSKDDISIHVEKESNVDIADSQKSPDLVEVVQTFQIKGILRQNKVYIIKVAYFVLLCLYLTYLGFSISTSLNGSIALLVFTSLAVVIFAVSFAHRRYHTHVESWIENVKANRTWNRHPKLQLYIGRYA